jgi:hypothetical protein
MDSLIYDFPGSDPIVTDWSIFSGFSYVFLYVSVPVTTVFAHSFSLPLKVFSCVLFFILVFGLASDCWVDHTYQLSQGKCGQVGDPLWHSSTKLPKGLFIMCGHALGPSKCYHQHVFVGGQSLGF